MPRTNQTIKTSVPAANAAATVTFPAIGDRRWRIDSILASYSGAPTAGRLTVVSDQALLPDGTDPAAKTVLDVDLNAAGLATVHVPVDGLQMPDGNATLTVALAAAGAGVIGKLHVVVHAE